MSADTIGSGEGAASRPPLDLTSPWFTLAVAALVPLLRTLQFLRDVLARKISPLCCLGWMPAFLLVSIAWGAYTPLIFRLGRRFPPSRLQNVFVHLGAVIVLALPIELAWWFFASPELHRPPPDPFFAYALYHLAISIVPYAVILGAGVLRDRYVERTRYTRLLLRLERQLAETELAALRAQLDPALLGSALTAIEQACRDDEERAERLVVSLADFLRITLEQIERPDATLGRELARLQAFVRVLNAVHGKNVQLDIDDDETRALAVPPQVLADVRELVEASPDDALLRLRVGDDGTLTIGTRTWAVRPDVSDTTAETLPAVPDAKPFTLDWPVAAALLIVTSFFGRATMETGTNKSLFEFLRWATVGTLLTAPGCFASVWGAHRLAGARRIGVVLPTALVGTFVAAYLCELAYALVRPDWGELNSVSAMVGFLPAVARSRAVAFNHLLFLMLALFAIAVRYEERTRDVLALHARVREAQLRKLRGQIRPHFLFNSLNSILGRLGREPDEAAEMAASLRRFLQTTFEVEQRSAVPLAEELEAVREYLDIERNRAGSRMRVQWDVDERAREARVPALLLQPLVENAVQHGVASVSRAVRIVISAKRIGRSLVLAVADDGAGPGAGGGRGMGLKTTEGLLAAFYGPDAQFSAGPRAPHGFEVRLVVPVR